MISVRHILLGLAALGCATGWTLGAVPPPLEQRVLKGMRAGTPVARSAVRNGTLVLWTEDADFPVTGFEALVVVACFHLEQQPDKAQVSRIVVLNSTSRYGWMLEQSSRCSTILRSPAADSPKVIAPSTRYVSCPTDCGQFLH